MGGPATAGENQPSPADDAARRGATQFLSDAWFERARALCSDLPRRPGLSWRLQFDAADAVPSRLRWFQVVEDGQVTQWQPGDLEAPDLELRWAAADARAVHTGTCSGTEAMAALRIWTADAGECSAPPVNIGDTGDLSRLPTIPDATLSVQFEFDRGPFGPVSCWMSFVDGRSAGIGFGRVPDPDVRVAISYSKMVGVCTDELTIWEALEDGGRIDGDVGPIMLLSALEESDELLAAQRAAGPPGLILAKLGELAATTEYAAVQRDLRAVTA